MQERSISSDRQSDPAPAEDSVEPMHRGARVEVDDSGGATGEHSGQTPDRQADAGDDEAPVTPTDEPTPIPVQDPPSNDHHRSPLTVDGDRP